MHSGMEPVRLGRLWTYTYLPVVDISHCWEVEWDWRTLGTVGEPARLQLANHICRETVKLQAGNQTHFHASPWVVGVVKAKAPPTS